MSETLGAESAETSGKGWSITTGERLAEEAHLVKTLDKNDVSRFMKEEARQRFMAIEAFTYAFELVNPDMMSRPDLLSAAQSDAARVAMAQSEATDQTLNAIVAQASESGLADLPITSVLDRIAQAAIVEPAAVLRARAVVAQLLIEEQSPTQES